MAILPMDRGVGGSYFSLGVSRVVTAIEIKRSLCRTGLASIRFALSVMIASSVFVPRAYAQSEDQVMAAFLYNFARYVEWPKDAFDGSDSPVEICMLGSRDFSSVVAKIVSGKKVGHRPVVVTDQDDLAASTSCHILFVGPDATSKREKIFDVLGRESVFTVADSEGFASAGGVANFLRVDKRIRFEINANAAKTAGLKISSRLLRLAKVVE